ncbi:MAG: hypothetical protein ACK5MF_18215 [Vibrio sp.]|uniref:hypothetical protein n=1 Tax=Vibrio sp. TaxID=678 RepID=UPI003A8C059F
MKYIEKQIKHCDHCEQLTAHYRKRIALNGLKVLIHLTLTLLSLGIWLLLVFIWLLFDMKAGEWKCYECEIRKMTKETTSSPINKKTYKIIKDKLCHSD